MTQNGNSPINFEPHEWSIIVLLRAVREKVLDEMIKRWKKSDEQNTHYNLITAFLNVIPLLDYDREIQQELLIGPKDVSLKDVINYSGFEKIVNSFVLDVKTGDKKKKIKSYETFQNKLIGGLNEIVYRRDIDVDKLNVLLDKKCHLLFNSYFYTAVTAFGEDSLIPIIPGYRPTLDSEQQEQSWEKMLQYANANKLPFRINPDNLDLLASQVLPCKAGITPYYFDAIKSGNYPNQRKTFCIPYFLGDPRILLKYDDFLQGNISAMTSILGPKYDWKLTQDKYVGAFVLTCLVPRAFNKEDEANMDKLVDDLWEIGLLSVEQKPVLAKDNAIVNYGNPKFEKNVSDRDAITLQEDFKDRLKQTCVSVGSAGRDIVGFKVEFDRISDSAAEETAEDGALFSPIVLNLDSLYRIIKSIFPGGPWLDRALVCQERNKGDHEEPIIYIDVSRLESLRDLIRGLFAPLKKNSGTPSNDEIQLLINEFTAVRSVMDILLPELAFLDTKGFLESIHERMITMPFENGEEITKDYSIVIIMGQKNIDISEISKLKTFTNFQDKIEKLIVESPAADGGNVGLVRLQSEWISRNFSMVNTTGDESIDALRQLMLDKELDARAVFILRRKAAYTPSLSSLKALSNELQLRFLSYPNYWLCESLCHFFTEQPSFLDIRSLSCNLGKLSVFLGYENKHPIGIEASEMPLPQVTVTIGEKNDFMKVIMKIFLYLGIPVSEWLIKKDAANIEVEIGYEEGHKQKKSLDGDVINKFIADIYQEYLNGYFSSSLFKNILVDLNLSKIDSTSFSLTDHDNIQQKLLVSGQDEIIIDWQRVPDVFDIECCCLQGERIIQAMEERTFWQAQEAKEIPLKCSLCDKSFAGDRNYQCAYSMVTDELHPNELHPRVHPVLLKLGQVGIETGRAFKHDDIGLVFKNDKVRHNGICAIAARIKAIEDNANMQRSRERAELLPQLSHAIGTELSALASAFGMFNEKLKRNIEGKKSNLSVAYNRFRWHFDQKKIQSFKDFELACKNDSELINILNNERKYASLTEEDMEIIKALIDMNLEPLTSTRDLLTKLEEQQGIASVIYFLNKMTPKMKLARDKNRAILRLHSKDARVSFEPKGEFSLEETFYAAVIIALEHFWGNTIFRSESLYDIGKFTEDAYRKAFEEYWPGVIHRSYFEHEMQLWNERELYALDENFKEKFDIWQDKYNKLDTSRFEFKLDIAPLRYKGDEGSAILSMFFQELLLNGLKYSKKSDKGKKITIECQVERSEDPNENGIETIEFKSVHRVQEAKADGKGRQFIDIVLRNILQMKPMAGQTSFWYIDSGIYYVKGRRE